METAYDFVTVALFAIMVAYYVLLTDHRMRLLMHFLLSAVVFAVADQLGNYAIRSGAAGVHALAVVLIIAGVAYAAIVARSR